MVQQNRKKTHFKMDNQKALWTCWAQHGSDTPIVLHKGLIRTFESYANIWDIQLAVFLVCLTFAYFILLRNPSAFNPF